MLTTIAFAASAIATLSGSLMVGSPMKKPPPWMST
jgi:hypothetical protein